jgi:acyl-phosphate glycerol 3-phosphate acyltransferase
MGLVMSREALAGVLSLISGYLIGAVPFGYILYRMRGGLDIRHVGSGNIGASNVMRLGGVSLGVATFLLDAGKGAGAVALARWSTADPTWEASSPRFQWDCHCWSSRVCSLAHA